MNKQRGMSDLGGGGAAHDGQISKLRGERDAAAAR